MQITVSYNEDFVLRWAVEEAAVGQATWSCNDLLMQLTCWIYVMSRDIILQCDACAINLEDRSTSQFEQANRGRLLAKITSTKFVTSRTKPEGVPFLRARICTLKTPTLRVEWIEACAVLLSGWSSKDWALTIISGDCTNQWFIITVSLCDPRDIGIHSPLAWHSE